jgi:mRNA interferase RelE/StbE
MLTVLSTSKFNHAFKKLERQTQLRVNQWIEKKLIVSNNPRLLGKNLCGNFSGLWRYRLGDLRIICRIDDTSESVLMLSIGHRSEIYA